MKKTIFLVLVLIVVLFSSTISMAADYPTKPVTLIVPFSAGGGTDITARMLSEELKSILGVNVIVVNKPGGGGAIGTIAAVASKPDGYTLLIMDLGIISAYYMGVVTTRWDDMQPVCRVDKAINTLVVHYDAPWKTAQEYIDDAKARPGEISIGVTGLGGSTHLNAENLKLASGADIKMVSFEGGAKSVAALAGKHIDSIFCQPAEARGFLDAGEFRMLAVSADERHPEYPDIPTFIEIGVDFKLSQNKMIFAPKNTPMDRVNIIANAVELAMETERVKKLLKNTLLLNAFLGPEELTVELQKQDKILKNIVEDSGLLK